MKSHFKLLAVLAIVLLTGQGCLSFGGSKSDGSRDGGVFKSTDGGVEWAQAVAYPTSQGVGSLAAIDVLSLAIDPQDHETLYMGSKENGLFFSINSGSSWQVPRNKSLQTGAIRSIAVDPKDVCAVYAVLGTRLYKTEDCTRSFESMYEETRSNVSVRRVAVDWYAPDTVYIGLSNGDVLKSTDRGEAWTKVLEGDDDVTEIMVSNSDSRVVFVATEGGMYKTADSGASWVKLEEALKDYRDGSNIFSLVQNTDGSSLIMATKYGLLRSLDLGETWEALQLVTSAGQVTIRALAIDPSNADTIYYATSSTFYTSNDGGVTWETQKLPSTRAASVLRVDPTAPSTMYLGVLRLEQ
jgi:photosystem II stability/assembly factor-like uncharacterized protein